MNYGFNVRIVFKETSPFGKVEETRNNVTEIHYGYDSFGKKDSVAFVSDIHLTGGTLKIDYIEEFEAILATKKENYY